MPPQKSSSASKATVNKSSVTKQKKPSVKKLTKSTATSVVTESAPVVTESAHVVTESAPVVTESAPVVTESAPVVTESAPVVTESTDTTLGLDSIETEFLSLANRLQDLRTLQNTLVADFKKLHKNVQRHMKDAGKKNKRKKVTQLNGQKRAPSGFAKATEISTELCSFLGKPQGTEMARTEVTKYLTQYIKQHELQDKSNRRKILPDAPLQKLLNVKKDDEVTYFNLQKYMKVHFPKSIASIAAASATAATATATAATVST
jgi:chromatin remodeling complex protein RSC6